jgi:NADH-quinone oxidoreductase subunit L
MFRLIYLTFHGKERISAHARKHLHESPKAMTIPLMVLAVLSVIGGWVGIPHIFFGATNLFEHWLDPVIAKVGGGEEAHALASTGSHGAGMEWGLMGVSVLLVIVAILTSRYFYNQNLNAATTWQKRFAGLHKTMLNKYYVDEIYSAVVIRPVVAGSMFLWKIFDVLIIDGFVNGLATITSDASELLKFAQSGKLRVYVTIFLTGVVLLIGLVVFG